MLNTLKCDLHKTLISLAFPAAALVTFLLCFTENIYIDSTLRAYSVSEALFELPRELIESRADFCALNIFKRSLSGYSTMFLPILASFPFVFSQTTERNSGNIRLSIFRSKRIKYYISKFITAILSGGLGVMLGVLLFGIFANLAFPVPSAYEYFSYEYEAPQGVALEVLKKLFSAFLFGCSNTVLSFFLSAFCRNKYLILCVPFLFKFMLDTALNKIIINAEDFSIYDKIFPFESYAPAQIPYISAEKILLVIAVMTITSGILLAGHIIIMENRADKGD